MMAPLYDCIPLFILFKESIDRGDLAIYHCGRDERERPSGEEERERREERDLRRTDEMTAWKLYNKRWDSTKISTNALGAFEADWGPAKNARLRKIEDGEMRLATYLLLPTYQPTN